MLIEFTFGNFRSFRTPVTFSMVAAKTTSEDKSLDENILIPIHSRLKLLTSAAVYGANASGKSNFMDAIRFMRRMVVNSSRESQAGDPIEVEPFKLHTLNEESPSMFEVTFITQGVRFRYGFEATLESVESEWLYMASSARETELFYRQAGEFSVNQRSFREGRGLFEKTRSNSLFLSVVAQFNGPTSLKVQSWFQKLVIISGLQDYGSRTYTIRKFVSDENNRAEIVRFVKAFDLDIEDIWIENEPLSTAQLPKDMPVELRQAVKTRPDLVATMKTGHKKFGADNQFIGIEGFTLEHHESAGTQKLIYLAGPLLDALKYGRTICIDEFEARFHTGLTIGLIRLFNSLETNPQRAQLIFTTHDTNLLDKSIFRRDQIWFLEKGNYQASHLYSLVEFKIRNDASFEKDYLRGRYGAVPYLGDFSQVVATARTVAEQQENYDA